MERAAFPQTRDADDTAASGHDASYWDYLSTPHHPAESR